MAQKIEQKARQRRLCSHEPTKSGAQTINSVKTGSETDICYEEKQNKSK